MPNRVTRVGGDARVGEIISEVVRPPRVEFIGGEDNAAAVGNGGGRGCEMIDGVGCCIFDGGAGADFAAG